MSEHQDNLHRVQTKIAPAILDFQKRTGLNVEFHAQDLRDYIAEAMGLTHAPNSAYRVMYAMRDDGLLNYELVSRPKSLYKFVPLAESQPDPLASELDGLAA